MREGSKVSESARAGRQAVRTQWRRFPSVKQQEQTSFENRGERRRKRERSLAPKAVSAGRPLPCSHTALQSTMSSEFSSTRLYIGNLSTSVDECVPASCNPRASADSLLLAGTPSSKSAPSTARSPSSTTSSTRLDQQRASRAGTRSSSMRRRRFVELPPLSAEVEGERGTRADLCHPLFSPFLCARKPSARWQH